MMRKLYFLILIGLSSQMLYAQTVRYVKPVADGTGDGSNWANASADLQAMIDASASGDQVWVAAGTYMPTEKIANTLNDGTTPTTSRDQAFILRTGVKVYGGFAGTESLLTERNYVSNETILSGDLGTVGDKTDNAYHLVIARIVTAGTEKAVLDGFTLQDGYANGTGTVTAGLNLDQNQGAAINLRGTDALGKTEFSNLIIKNNESSGAGGAAYIYSSGNGNLTFRNVQFLNNLSGASGGAIYITRTGTTNPNFTLDNTVFSGNQATLTSGAIYYANSSTGVLKIINSKFNANISNGGVGGAIYYYSGNSEIYNSVFYNNQASSSGGGMYVSSGNVMTTVTVANSTFFQNKANSGQGGAISFWANADYTTLNLYNNIFHQNTSATNYADLRASAAGVLVFKNNLFQAYATAAGSDDTFVNTAIDAAPAQLFASTTPTDANFLQLVEGAATQKGDAALLPADFTTDLAGNPRVTHSIIDLGAYEYQGTLPVEFDYFRSKKEGRTAVLSWKTLNENNSQKFTLERGTALDNFTLIKTTPSVGNTDQASYYSYTDVNPFAGDNYYKLTQYDNDGKARILGVQTLTFEIDAAKTTIYPNPANGYVWIKSPSSSNGISSLNLISLTGQNILTNNYAQTTSHEGVKLDLANIPTGTYILWVNKGKPNAEKQTLLVVK
jgi:predicted outer membrane repeat protein